jgi:hypothetical protein
MTVASCVLFILQWFYDRFNNGVFRLKWRLPLGEEMINGWVLNGEKQTKVYDVENLFHSA